MLSFGHDCESCVMQLSRSLMEELQSHTGGQPVGRLGAPLKGLPSMGGGILGTNPFLGDPRLLPLRAEPYGRQNTAQ